MARRTAERYRKVLTRTEALVIPRREWRVVIASGAGEEEIRRAYRILKSLEGCVVMADAVLCWLEYVKLPPGWTLVSWAEPGWMWFPLGRCVSISLPRTDPPV